MLTKDLKIYNLDVNNLAIVTNKARETWVRRNLSVNTGKLKESENHIDYHFIKLFKLLFMYYILFV